MTRLVLSGPDLKPIEASYSIAACSCSACSAALKIDGSPIASNAEPVVSDFTALISGFTIHDTTNLGAFYSFSFPEVLPDYYGDIYSSQGLNTFRPFSETEKNVARAAIQSYADISGLTFFEVAPDEGDIKFMVFDLDILTPGDEESAFAYYPIAAGFSRIASDVFVDFREVDRYVLLHEIGHTVGLKHPFEDSPILLTSLDNVDQTVMSYTFRPGSTGTELGPLDIQAVQALYGNAGADGNQINQWSWNPITRTLSQTGSTGVDIIQGIGGSDVITALGGNDTIYAAEGDDTVFGGDGADDIYGGYGDDSIDAGAGNDYIVWDGGNDTMLGGDGDDDFVFFEPVGNAILRIEGGAGEDYVSFAQFASPTTFSLAERVAAGWVIEGIEQVALFGSSGGDNITGAATPDQIQGEGGNDTLDGGGGEDTLFGGDGNDFVSGGAGNDFVYGDGGDDTLDGGAGADTIDGGAGFDMASYASENAGVTVTVNGSRRIGSDTEFLSNVEGLIGSGFADTLTGDSNANRIEGGAGNDTIAGGGGSDTLAGGEGDDRIEGGTGDDMIDGGDGADSAVFADTLAQCTVTFDGEVCIVTTTNQGVDRLTGVETIVFGDQTRTVESFRNVGDTSPPRVVNANPANGATDIPIAAFSIFFQFDDYLRSGEGVITLGRADGRISETLIVGQSDQILLNGGPTLFLEFSNYFMPGTAYVITISAGAVTDTAGNPSEAFTTNFTTVPAGPTNGFQLITSPGLAAAVGGDGRVFGTRGTYQEIMLADTPGTIQFDASFGSGGDLIIFEKAAAEYMVRLNGSSAVITDGDSVAIIPSGLLGTDLSFADGIRSLAIEGGQVVIGTQLLTTTQATIVAAPGPAEHIFPALDTAAGSVNVRDISRTTIGGDVTIFGARNSEQIVSVVEVEGGVVRFDASFNAGGDRIIFEGDGTGYTARRDGSSVIIERGDADIILPAGTAGAILDFSDGERTLMISGGQVVIDDQVITTAAANLMGFG